MQKDNLNDDETHFGYSKVDKQAKARLVADVFDKVAPKYDLMNDVMSVGMHRLWKRFTIAEAAVKPGQHILDVAAGSGDLSKAFAKLVGPTGKVIMTDINPHMLAVGRGRLADAGIIGNVEFIEADAEKLPFEDNSFDCVTIAFGLRNVTDKNAALRSMFRVLKPGGKCLILEFSQPPNILLAKAYDAYSFNIIPKLGQLISNDRDSYQYLVESIRMHPKQDELKAMLQTAGFDDVSYFNLTGGIVALHKGYKY